jgi:tetratricopeptide (TPR) repeat protein
MSESNSLNTRYFELIDRLVEDTLNGKIASKAIVYKRLVKGIDRGTGEIFERCLSDRLATTQAELETKLKATRILRALQTIKQEWQRLQQENQDTDVIADASDRIAAAESPLLAFVKIIDSNQNKIFNREELEKLSHALKTKTSSNDDCATAQPSDRSTQNLRQIATGISEGLKSCSLLEEDLISWMYEGSKSSLGFNEEKFGPWSLWAKKIDSPLPKQLFQTLARDGLVAEFARSCSSAELAAWVELIVLLQYLEKGLINWFDRQAYDLKAGKKSSLSTFISFSMIWCELSKGFNSDRNELDRAFFQITLQVLRSFAKREDFPLYGGIFISFSGQYLKNTLTYLDEPLRQVEATKEKARLLTLLAYSQKVLGQYDRASEFYQEALAIARTTEDRPCEIAALNHLSRIRAEQKNYTEAIDYSQRALILSRQLGDRLGEANGLVNLGYAEIFSARQLEQVDTDTYERSTSYLERGLELAEKLKDIQSQALGYNSLGIAYVTLSQPAAAITTLAKGIELAQLCGDVYLQGLSFVYLAEAYYSLEDKLNALFNACLGMYYLEQIDFREWRQPAGLIAILQGKMDEEEFKNLWQQIRTPIISAIGVDGYDYLPTLLEKYKQG